MGSNIILTTLAIIAGISLSRGITSGINDYSASRSRNYLIKTVPILGRQLENGAGIKENIIKDTDRISPDVNYKSDGRSWINLSIKNN